MKQQMRNHTNNETEQAKKKILIGLLSYFRMMCKLDFVLDLIITIRTQDSLFGYIDSVMWENRTHT